MTARAAWFLRQLILVGGLIAVVRYALGEGYLSEAAVRQTVERAGPLAVPVFVLATALGCVLLAPLAVPVGAAAIVFGTATGSLYAWMGTVLGACAAFGLARHVAPDLARRHGHRWPRFRAWIEARLATRAVAFVALVKLAFYGNSALSYAAALTSVRFRDFAMGSVVGCLPGVIVLSHACEAVIRAESTTALLTHPAVLVLAGFRLAGLALLLGLAGPGRRDGLTISMGKR